MAIAPPSTASSNSTSGSGSSTHSSGSSSGVPVGAVAGGAVGGVAVLVALGLLIWFFCIKPRRRRAVAELEAATTKAAESERPQQYREGDSLFLKPELETTEIRQAAEMEDPTKSQWTVETDGTVLRPKNEMDGTSTPVIHEMDGKRYYEIEGKKYLYPSEGEGEQVEIHEMPAREEVAAEMGHRDPIEPAPEPRWSWATTPGADLMSPGAPVWREGEERTIPPVPSPPISGQSPQISQRSPQPTERSLQISQPSPQTTEQSPQLSHRSPQSPQSQISRKPIRNNSGL